MHCEKEWFESFSFLVAWKTKSRFWAISNKSRAFNKAFWVMAFKLVEYWHEQLIIARCCIHGCCRISNNWSLDNNFIEVSLVDQDQIKKLEIKDSKKKHRVKHMHSPMNLNCLNHLVILGGELQYRCSLRCRSKF